MKKITVLSIVTGSILALSSFTINNKSLEQKRDRGWVVTCADGSYGGSFSCDCTQAQANHFAELMCE
jgi:hypothetical protein